MTSALKRIQVSPIPAGPAASNLDTVAEDALKNLLGTQASNVQTSAPPANDNGNGPPPIVTMEPIPNPEEKARTQEEKSLDDLFSEAQRRNQ